MGHTYTSLLYHVIFSTKGREPTIDANMRPRLFAYMGGIVREIGGRGTIVNGVADHVHTLHYLPPVIAVSDAMRTLKANSSKWVHENWPQGKSFAWQTGYAAFGVSESNSDQVKQYIANQDEHHKRVTFQEEYIAFLKRHGVVYDERYVLE